MTATDITTKRCTKCGEHKQREAFSKDADKRDGLNTRCKLCRSAGHAIWRAENPLQVKANNDAWYAANIDKARAYSRSYRAANPESVKTSQAAWHVANPEKSKAGMAAWYAVNKDRVIASNAAWRAKNRKKVNGYSAAWKMANPETRRIHSLNRRAKLQDVGGKLSKGLFDKLFKLQRGKCACCKIPLGDKYHRDHNIPLALGGPNEDWNMQLLCKPCNLQKSAKHPVDFMQKRGFLL